MTLLLEADVIKQHKKKLFDISEEIKDAKKYLQQHSITSGCSIYDHLAELIQKILICKPEEIVETFEVFSKQVKDERFVSNFDTLQDQYTPLECLENIKQMLNFYRLNEHDDKSNAGEDSEENVVESNEVHVPNIMETNFYFQQAGFGFIDEEAFSVALALKKLAKEPSIAKIRFFGKIFGIKRNYYVAETDLTSEEIANRLKKIQINKMSSIEDDTNHIDRETPNKKNIADLQESENDKYAEDAKPVDSEEFPQLPPIPKSAWTPPVTVPQENPGEGCNKKVYWVCNKLGDEWVSLPDVTPEHINISRHIIRYMTGDLDTPLHTYPPLEGTERDHLRAQIARIVAGTSVSPLAYYIRATEDEDIDQQEDDSIEEVDDKNTNEQESTDNEEVDNYIADIKENKHFKGHSIENMTDKSLSFWVHHSQHILKQGRTIWWNPDAPEEYGEEDEDKEVGGEEEIPAPLVLEQGPAILTSLSEDKSIGEAPAWAAVACCKSIPSATLAFLHSRRWPGAVAYATKDGKFDNMYIGWGVKCNPEGFSPMPLPPMCEEYSMGPEIIEMTDPTPQDEENYRQAQMRPEPPQINAEDEEELQGEDESDEDASEDD